MSVRMRTAALLAAALVTPISCAGLGGDRGDPLPFKVAIIPFEPTVVPGDATATTDDGSFGASFDPSTVEESIRAALATRFTEAVVLQPPPGATLAEFLRRPRPEQDSHWIRACAEANVDLVLECDAKLPDRARCSHNEAFWLNLPIFFIGGPICWFVDDTDYDADARLVASLHQVIPIEEGRATLSNGRAEVARFDARFDGVRLDFIDRAETWSYAASIVVPPGLLANDNTRVRRRFALAVGDGLATNLARQVAETSDSILRSEDLADFYVSRDVKAIARGRDVRVEGEVVMRGSAVDMRQVAISCGSHRVEGMLATSRADPIESTARETFVRAAFSGTLPRESGVNVVRIELVQNDREQVARTFTAPILDPHREGD